MAGVSRPLGSVHTLQQLSTGLAFPLAVRVSFGARCHRLPVHRLTDSSTPAGAWAPVLVAPEMAPLWKMAESLLQTDDLSMCASYDPAVLRSLTPCQRKPAAMPRAHGVPSGSLKEHVFGAK